MFLTVNKDVLTMLMTSLARDASALGSIEVEVEVEGRWVAGSTPLLEEYSTNRTSDIWREREAECEDFFHILMLNFEGLNLSCPA